MQRPPPPPSSSPARIQKCQISTTCRPRCIVFICVSAYLPPKFMLSLSAMFDIWRYNCPKATHRQAGSKTRKAKCSETWCCALGVVQQPEREPNRTCAVACSEVQTMVLRGCCCCRRRRRRRRLAPSTNLLSGFWRGARDGSSQKWFCVLISRRISSLYRKS